MKHNTNGVERIIRQFVVKPRNISRALPNMRAAQILADLQTIHTNAAKRGMSPSDFIREGDKPRDVFWSGKSSPILSGAAQDAGDNTARPG